MNITDISVCQDCIMILANGDCGENSEEHADRMYSEWWTPGCTHQMVLGGEELGFSMSDCEGCGDTLGGDRFSAHVMD